MSEMNKTLTFVGVAAVMVLLAFLTTPKRVTPDALADQGQPFFPEFTDPNAALTLEVIEFDEATAAARPFKVTNKDGLWTIPSQHDYPADGKERLAKIAASIIAVKKDSFRSDNVADHVACGVLDPLEADSTELKGRGKRVTIKGAGDKVLADLIIGNVAGDEPEGQREEGGKVRFVRVPGQKRIYSARIDADISTKFEDWIEKDVLELTRSDIDQIVIRDYSVNEETASLEERDVVTLSKAGSDWTMDKLTTGQELDTGKVNNLISAIDDLSITGVRPKPAGLSQRLQRLDTISQIDMLALQEKGFFFNREGKLLANEGDIEVRTTKGMTYTLRFGEIASGEGELQGVADSTKENRYLFISVESVSSASAEPPEPTNMDFQGKPEAELTGEDRENQMLFEAHEEWARQNGESQKLQKELEARFGGWFYVISSENFDRIHVKRADLIREKASSD